MTIRISIANKFVCAVAFATLLFFAAGLKQVSAQSNASANSPASVSKAQSLLVVDNMTTDTENTLIGAADYYWHHGDYPRIIALDRDIVEMDPGNTESYSNAGWLMESMGDLKDAEQFYTLGVNRNSTSSYMAYQLAFFYFNTVHRYDKAIVVLKKSTGLHDSGAVDYKLLAHSYTRVKNYRAALAEWKIIKQKFPTAVAVDHNLQEAQAEYKASLSNAPNVH